MTRTTPLTYIADSTDSLCNWIVTLAMLAPNGLTADELTEQATPFDADMDADQMADFCFMLAEEGLLIEMNDDRFVAA